MQILREVSTTIEDCAGGSAKQLYRKFGILAFNSSVIFVRKSKAVEAIDWSKQAADLFCKAGSAAEHAKALALSASASMTQGSLSTRDDCVFAQAFCDFRPTICNFYFVNAIGAAGHTGNLQVASENLALAIELCPIQANKYLLLRCFLLSKRFSEVSL